MPALTIAVRVRPGTSRTKVGGFWGDDCQLVVAVNAPPVDGAANEAVVDAVAKAFAVKRRQVSIASGHTSRSKVLAIQVPEEEVPALQARLVELRQLG